MSSISCANFPDSLSLYFLAYFSSSSQSCRLMGKRNAARSTSLQRIMSACSSFGSDWHSLQMCSACPLPEKLSLDLWQPHTLQ